MLALFAFTGTECDLMDDHACEVFHLLLVMLSLPDPIREVVLVRPTAHA